MARHLSKNHMQTFESLKHTSEEGAEYWYARELQVVLEYSSWEKFTNVIEKAITACKPSGYPQGDHFHQTVKLIQAGKGAQRSIEDYKLLRYACYLIVQNGDPNKPVIANGQTYFAIQTRRKELEDDAEFKQLNEEQKRLLLRKGLKKSQKILDHMGSTELAANLFRATQTEEMLRRDKIQTKHQANLTHYEVGTKIRKTIKQLGGTMPENLPTPTQSIKGIKQKKTKQLEKHIE